MSETNINLHRLQGERVEFTVNGLLLRGTMFPIFIGGMVLLLINDTERFLSGQWKPAYDSWRPFAFGRQDCRLEETSEGFKLITSVHIFSLLNLQIPSC